MNLLFKLYRVGSNGLMLRNFGVTIRFFDSAVLLKSVQDCHPCTEFEQTATNLIQGENCYDKVQEDLA